MAIKHTEEESKALSDKARDPGKTVLCPRCGKELMLYACGNSYEVYCTTENCIKRTVRGI